MPETVFAARTPRVSNRASRSAERQIVRLTSRHYARLARMGFENRLLADWITRSRLMTSVFRRSRRY